MSNFVSMTKELIDDSLIGLDDMIKENFLNKKLKKRIIKFLNKRPEFIGRESSKDKFTLNNTHWIMATKPTVHTPISDGSRLFGHNIYWDRNIFCDLEFENYFIGVSYEKILSRSETIIAVYKIPDEAEFYFPIDWQNALLSTIRMHLPLWAMKFIPEAKLRKYIIKRNRMKLEEVK